MTHIAEHLSRARLEEILHLCVGKKIGVVGDLGLDAYWYADMTRAFLSRETPHFARPVVREAYSPGAGANVADNLRGMGVGHVVVYSVLGEDWRGAILQRELAERGIEIEHLIVSDRRSTTTFIKPVLMGYDSQQEEARLDFENPEPLPPALEDELLGCLERELPNLDALLVADQLDLNGVITTRVREGLNRLAAAHPEVVCVADSRQRIGLFKDMVLKPNWVEAVAAVHAGRDPRDVSHAELAKVGSTLSQRSGRPTFVTLSEEGVLVCAEGKHGRVSIPPVRAPLDPVGAGDTFISALAATLSVGGTPWEAGAVANLAAAVTVEKLNQTGTASPQEILARYALTQEMLAL